MESVVIATPAGYATLLRDRLERIMPLAPAVDGLLAVEDGRTRVYVRRDEGVRAEIEPARLRRITARIANPEFYCVDFSDIAFCRRVLIAIADDPKVLVDNDHGVLLPGKYFVRLLHMLPDWDWRRDREDT